MDQKRIAHQGGFTLIELLVILAIIALVLASVPGFMFRSQPGLNLDVVARAIAGSLRQTRSQAMLKNQEQVFVLDAEKRRFRAGGADMPISMEEAVEFRFLTARSELLNHEIGQIRFFPDGSSTGGQISLALGSQRVTISVDWLTGLVTVDRAE